MTRPQDAAIERLALAHGRVALRSGLPTWTWPEWRTAPAGLRVRHSRSGETGTFLGPAKNRHNGARVRWDRVAGIASRPEAWAYVVAPARDLTPVRIPAWDLIGFDGTRDSVADGERLGLPERGLVRVRGGRAVYEQVDFQDATRGDRVRLGRLDVGSEGLRPVVRYVEASTELELVEETER